MTKFLDLCMVGPRYMRAVRRDLTDKMTLGHEFPHHQVGSPRGASLNLAERRRATEDVTERKEVLGEGKSIVGEGSCLVEVLGS